MKDPMPLVKRIEQLLPKKPVEALDYCSELRGIALEKKKYDLLAREEGYRGRSYIAISKVSEGKQTLAHALGWYRRWQQYDSYAGLINSVGADYYQLKEYQNARQWLAAAVQTATRTHAPQVLYKSLYNLGKIEELTGNFLSARRYMEKSLDIASSSRMPLDLSPMLLSLGKLHKNQGHFSQAEQVLVRGRKYAQDKQEWPQALRMGLEIASLFMDQKNYPESRIMYHEVLRTAQERNLLYYELLARIGLVKVLLLIQDSQEIVRVIEEAVHILKNRPNLQNPETIEAFKLAALVSQKVLSDKTRAYVYYVHYRKAIDQYHR